MLSPSVQTNTHLEPTKHYYPGETSEIAAFVGFFERGPINVPIYIQNIDEFKFLFGRGIDYHANDWYQVYNFLQYNKGIYVIRASGENNNNSNSNGDLIYINRYSDWLEQSETLTTVNTNFIARTSGTWGNTVSVSVINKTDYDNNVTIGYDKTANEIFTFFEDNYYGICVFKSDTLVETFYKQESELNEINTESIYLYVIPGVMNSHYDETILGLNNGYNTAPVETNFVQAYETLENPDEYDIDIIIGNEFDNQKAIDLAESRKDCIVFIGLPSRYYTFLSIVHETEDHVLVTQNNELILFNEETTPYLNNKNYIKIINYINSLSQSQYVHFTANIKKQYNHFANSNKYINVAGDIAGLKAQTSLINPWIPSAGLEKGLIKNNSEGFAFQLTKNQKDDFYKLGLNFIEKNNIMTQKTFKSQKSSFEKVHVRSLFNHLEKECKSILRNFIFSENTIGLRQSLAGSLKLYLEKIKINKGIEQARIYVEPFENNSILVQIVVKPKYTSDNVILKIHNSGTNEFISTIN